MKKRILIGSSLISFAGSVFAAVPTEVSTALTDAATDVVSVGGLALIAIVGAAAFKYMRRSL